MKKICVILYGILLICLTGCGVGESSNNMLSMGETINGTIFDFTLNDVQFTKYVVTSLNSNDFYLPTDSGQEYFYGIDGKKYENPNVAPSGKRLLTFDISLKYTGKQEYDGYFEDVFKLEYGDGYEFDIESMYIYKDGSWIFIDGSAVNHQSLDFETLDDTNYIIRGYFVVPEEVETNTNNSLKIKVNGLGNNKDYIIR